MIVTCSGHIRSIAEIRVSEFELKHKLVSNICRSV